MPTAWLWFPEISDSELSSNLLVTAVFSQTNEVKTKLILLFMCKNWLCSLNIAPFYIDLIVHSEKIISDQ